MKRFSLLALFAFLLAATGTLIANGPGGPNDPWPSDNSAYASNCRDQGTWHQVGYVSSSSFLQDPNGDNASTDITAWEDGCGNLQGRLSVWSRNGARLTGVGITGRFWQCNFLSLQIHIVSNVLWSGWYPSTGCGARMDDVGSSGTTACTPLGVCYNSNTGGVFYDTIWK